LKEKLSAIDKDYENTNTLINDLDSAILKVSFYFKHFVYKNRIDNFFCNPWRRCKKLKETYEDQLKLNKTLEESIAVKKRTINLINDVPANILRLKVIFYIRCDDLFFLLHFSLILLKLKGRN
jgi:phage regulator Rha-like protein